MQEQIEVLYHRMRNAEAEAVGIAEEFGRTETTLDSVEEMWGVVGRSWRPLQLQEELDNHGSSHYPVVEGMLGETCQW